MSNLKNQIKGLLSSPKELNKKQVALFLTQDKIDALDSIVKNLTAYSSRRINRNDLIEMAVDNLIEDAPKALNEYLNENQNKEKVFDTLVCPSKYDGRNVFLNEKKWYYVRMDNEKKSKIKYIAIYFGDPTSAITHYAKVKNIEEVEPGKNIIYLENTPIKLKTPIPLGEINAMAVRNNKYTTLEKLLNAREYSDLN